MHIISAMSYTEITYYIFAALVYGCVLTLIVLSLYYGRRARRNVKKEKITELKRGYSPLDIQRIFIGKTYPRKLTRALIVHWGNLGYINVKQKGRFRVTITQLKRPPYHDDEDAVFIDRGVYVRERDLFDDFMATTRRNKGVVDLRRPLFTKQTVKKVNSDYAVREDEGVYTAKHYTLKLVGLFLSVLPFLLCAIYGVIYTSNPVLLVLIGTGLIGLFVLKFVKGMPIVFKLIWCGMWLGASLGGVYGMFAGAIHDPFGTIYLAIAMFFVGSFFLIRFLDFRSKNNLAEYSDIVNYRKFLLFASKDEMAGLEYCEALPFLYAYNIKWLVKHKFKRANRPPKWYSVDGSGKGALL